MAKLGNVATAAKGGSVKAKVIGGLIVGVIALIILFNIFNFASTEANKIGLHYGGGVVEDKKFKSIIPPGSTNKLIGPGDTIYSYPIDQRSYIIGGAAWRTPRTPTRSPSSARTTSGSASGSRSTSR